MGPWVRGANYRKGRREVSAKGAERCLHAELSVKLWKRTSSRHVPAAFIQDTQNSVHAHGERKITEEPALVWLHLISATRKDAMVSNRQALVREKRNHYEKFHNWEFPLWHSGNESD